MSPTSSPTSPSPRCAAALLVVTVVVPLAFGRTVGPDTYRLFAEPLGVAVVAAVALCPLLALGRATGWTFRRAVRWPLLAAAIALPVLLSTGDWRSSVFGLVGPRGLLLRRRGRRHVRRSRRAAGRR